jgi:hypothetical protein
MSASLSAGSWPDHLTQAASPRPVRFARRPVSEPHPPLASEWAIGPRRFLQCTVACGSEPQEVLTSRHTRTPFAACLPLGVGSARVTRTRRHAYRCSASASVLHAALFTRGLARCLPALIERPSTSRSPGAPLASDDAGGNWRGVTSLRLRLSNADAHARPGRRQAIVSASRRIASCMFPRPSKAVGSAGDRLHGKGSRRRPSRR